MSGQRAGADNHLRDKGAGHARRSGKVGQAAARSRGVFNFAAIGRADLFPETPIAVKGFKLVIDEQAWIISRVVHKLNGNGYMTGLELEVKVSDVEYESEQLTQ